MVDGPPFRAGRPDLPSRRSRPRSSEVRCSGSPTGIYAVPGLPADTAAALAYDGVLSHLSAAAALELPLLVAPEKPHITLPPKRRPRPGPPAVLHWAATSADERRNRITSLLRTVVDCSRVLPFAEALAVADAALATGRLSQEELLAATAAMRGPGCPNARRMAAAATRRSGSFLESMLRALLITAGIDGFEPQVLVTNGWFRARVDLGHRAGPAGARGGRVSSSTDPGGTSPPTATGTTNWWRPAGWCSGSPTSR